MGKLVENILHGNSPGAQSLSPPVGAQGISGGQEFPCGDENVVGPVVRGSQAGRPVQLDAVGRSDPVPRQHVIGLLPRDLILEGNAKTPVRSPYVATGNRLDVTGIGGIEDSHIRSGELPDFHAKPASTPHAEDQLVVHGLEATPVLDLYPVEVDLIDRRSRIAGQLDGETV